MNGAFGLKNEPEEKTRTLLQDNSIKELKKKNEITISPVLL